MTTTRLIAAALVSGFDQFVFAAAFARGCVRPTRGLHGRREKWRVRRSMIAR